MDAVYQVFWHPHEPTPTCRGSVHHGSTMLNRAEKSEGRFTLKGQKIGLLVSNQMMMKIARLLTAGGHHAFLFGNSVPFIRLRNVHKANVNFDDSKYCKQFIGTLLLT